MQGRTALITGVLGQDGTLLAQRLIALGYHVVGAVKPGTPVPTVGPIAAVSFAAIDLTDRSAVRELLATCRPDEIYHLAASHHSSEREGLGTTAMERDTMLRTNFLTTEVLAVSVLDLAIESHLVYASSSQVFTAIEPCQVVDESSLRSPSTFYGFTKSWSMEMLAFLRHQNGLHASSAILFNHESPLRGKQYVTRKITLAAAQAALGLRPLVEIRNLGARTDWFSARDAVEAVMLMARSARAADYVVASGQLHSVKDILRVAFGHVGLNWAAFVSVMDDTESAALLGCPKALESRLGWQRRLDFETTIIEMVEHDIRQLQANPSVALQNGS
jgi:GDPmannose 4,6-dehydratase